MSDRDILISGHKGANRQIVEEAANEVGINLSDYNPDLRAKDAGKIGGRIGGKKGGRITKELIEAGKKEMESKLNS